MSKRIPNISAIDYKISNLHSELMDLYRRRSLIAKSDSKLSVDMIANPWEAMETARMYQAKWLDQQYQKLAAQWALFDIKIPALTKLRVPLSTSHKVIKELTASRPELKDKLEILLVPPTKLIGFPVKEVHRQKQIRVSGSDVVDIDFIAPDSEKNWKLLVVYNAPAGLYLGPPGKIISAKYYQIAGYDTRALGTNEYNALTLQRNGRIDTETWTMLLKKNKKDKTASGLVPVATFAGNRFRFDLDDINSLFGDIRFRPAIEIEGNKI